MARKRANLSDLLNDLTTRTIYEKFKMMACSKHTWSGLPDGILERHVERELFKYGKAIFFKAPGMGYMCLQAQDSGQLNVYGDPLWYIAYGYGCNFKVSAEECVIIENNLFRIPTHDTVLFYVNKISEAERTMDVNVKANKTPIIFTCDDKDALSFKHVFRQVDGNVPAIFADKRLNLDAITAFDTRVKFLGNDLMDYKHAVENELLTFLGLNNTPVEKKERLITDEANSNNELISSFSDLQLEARQRACREIKEKFGLEVTVELRSMPVESGEENEQF